MSALPFKLNQSVRVINPQHPRYGSVGIVTSCSYYITKVRFYIGRREEVSFLNTSLVAIFRERKTKSSKADKSSQKGGIS